MTFPALHRISQEITGGALIGQSFRPEHASKPAHEIDITGAPWTGHRRPKDCVEEGTTSKAPKGMTLKQGQSLIVLLANVR